MSRALLSSRTSLVWLFLIAATIVSWQVGVHGDPAELSTIIVLAVAFVKVRFVGLWFMELKDAPLPLRAVFEGYVMVVALALIIMYLVL